MLFSLNLFNLYAYYPADLVVAYLDLDGDWGGLGFESVS